MNLKHMAQDKLSIQRDIILKNSALHIYYKLMKLVTNTNTKLKCIHHSYKKDAPIPNTCNIALDLTVKFLETVRLQR